MSTVNIILHDVGTIFRATIKDEAGAIVDIATAPIRQLLFRKSDGTEVPKDADLTTDGTDGKIEYQAESGFLDTAGLWKFRGYVKFSDDEEFRTSNGRFFVERD